MLTDVAAESLRGMGSWAARVSLFWIKSRVLRCLDGRDKYGRGVFFVQGEIEGRFWRRVRKNSSYSVDIILYACAYTQK